MTIQEFDKLLASHDWTYCYADDYRYFVRGDGERAIIQERLSKNPQWKPLFTLYADYMLRGTVSKDNFIARRKLLIEQ